MPKIFDNIENLLSSGLNETLEASKRADFCVGYFNLRGWKEIAHKIEGLEGAMVNEQSQNVHRVCRLLIGMNITPLDILKSSNSLSEVRMDQSEMVRQKKKLAKEFIEQLTTFPPNNADEKGLRHLLKQLKQKKLAVKLHLRYPLHAKLYLCYLNDRNKVEAFLGSSNLTFAGLIKQGELNIDIEEQDANQKLVQWFNDRWEDRWCVDISKELIEVLENSWASEQIREPYLIYLKVAYHLSQEAREGINEFKIPNKFQSLLLPFQKEAVLIAAKKLNQRGIVMVGDVVGLGKTITACALARIFEEDFYYTTLVICPPKLKDMWETYKRQYDLKMEIMSLGQVTSKLNELKRFPIVIIDESHNLRSSEGNRYKAIKEYFSQNDNKVILLTATPYNKSFTDLSNQLRLIIPDDKDLGISPEQYIRHLGGAHEFTARHIDTFIRSIKAFERSDFIDDWRDLMRLFLVRRTRGFIKNEYGILDETNQRRYIAFADGSRSYFPDRIPKKVEYGFQTENPNDHYAKLYAKEVVDALNALQLPRYGLGQYLDQKAIVEPNQNEVLILANLTRAGKRLKGFTRTNLFKRLESSGHSFLLSLARHILRNYLFYYAIDQNLPLPIGKSFVENLDSYLIEDADADADGEGEGEDEANGKNTEMKNPQIILDGNVYMESAKAVYQGLQKKKHLFHWIPSHFFHPLLKKHLLDDAKTILDILQMGKQWNPDHDQQLHALHDLVAHKHATEKVLVFTQYADTAHYLAQELRKLGVQKLEVVTGATENLVTYTQRFSPKSNHVKISKPEDEIRVLLATDALSEGQNLQDAHIVVNYDLPWAIIRLIQRAGRVDRIGQQANKILCYSFLPEDGLEKIIKLRERLKKRIEENAEVVGTDEVFFEGDPVNLNDLYNEKAGALDEDDDNEVDLSSLAYQIWNQATKDNPLLKKKIMEMPSVVFATKPNDTEPEREGIVVYTRIDQENDMMAWLDQRGSIISQSQYTILKAIECTPETMALPRLEDHHELVEQGVRFIYDEVQNIEHSVQSGGALGRKTSVKYKVYHRLKDYIFRNEGTLFDSQFLKETHQDILNYPLREVAREILNRQVKSGINDDELASLVMSLKQSDKLSIIDDNAPKDKTPQIICSMGLKNV
jgi:superfamily II DNA or RNA helicase